MNHPVANEPSLPPVANREVVSDEPAKPPLEPVRRRRRWPIIIGVLVAAVVVILAIPRINRALNTVSTDDARVATWEQEKATLVLAQQEFDRTERLLATKVVSQEEYDQASHHPAIHLRTG